MKKHKQITGRQSMILWNAFIIVREHHFSDIFWSDLTRKTISVGQESSLQDILVQNLTKNTTTCDE